MTLIAVTASAVTIAMILSQLTVIGELRRAAKTQAHVPILQTLASFMSSILWLKYGLIKGDTTVGMVNALGSLVALYIVACFWYYSHEGRRLVESRFLLTLVMSVVVVAFVDYSGHSRAVDLFSLSCCAMSLVFLASPLGQVGHVVRQRDASVLLPSVAALAFANNVLWAAYGHIHADPFMFFPNAVGSLFCFLQLALIARYGRSAAKLPLVDSAIPDMDNAI
ncbi:Sugar transporter [Coemansia sp. RSA 2618]|nr:Sugar transporter [Coemansia sp. RSA 2618]